MNDKDVEIYLARFGERLLQLRKEKNFSQRELELESGIDKPYLRRLEKGKTNPTIKTLLGLSTALKVDINDLFDGINSKTD